MPNTAPTTPSSADQDTTSNLGRAASFGALTGGVLASTCCILPLVLVSIGVGGAWMSNLTALAPYQPFFLALAALSIGGGFWLSRRARNQMCAINGPCAHTITKKRYRIGLWVGGGLAVVAIAVNTLTPLLY